MEALYSTLIVENDGLVREGLKLLLEKTAFSPTACSLDVDFENEDMAPEILIMFAHDKQEFGGQIARFRECFPAVRIVVLATEGDLQVLSLALEAGANAILLTSISADSLVKALQAVVADNIFVMDTRIWPTGGASVVSTQDAAADEPNNPGASRGLSLREVEILRRIVEGDSNKHIARRLDIAEATVKAHVKTLLRKIGSSNRTQAAIWAMNNGLATEEAAGESAEGDAEADPGSDPRTEAQPDPASRRIAGSDGMRRAAHFQ